MQYAPHAITFILCLLSLAIAAKNAMIVTHCRDGVAVTLVLLVSLFQASTVVTFIVVQFGWVLNHHGDAVGEAAQLGWIAYDYQNLLFHICAGLTVRHWIKCDKVDR